MASRQECPSCGTPMRAIVWGYGTIADVADAGDVVIGGCVIDVDETGRVAALQCPTCGTRADERGIALEQPEPVVAVVEHPFSVSAVGVGVGLAAAPSGVPSESEERSMAAMEQPGFGGEDFGEAVGEGSWPGQATPYSSREDALPPPSAPMPDHVEPYASRDQDAPPAVADAWHDHVDPFEPPQDAPVAAPAREAVADSGTSDFTDAEEEGWPPGRAD